MWRNVCYDRGSTTWKSQNSNHRHNKHETNASYHRRPWLATSEWKNGLPYITEHKGLQCMSVHAFSTDICFWRVRLAQNSLTTTSIDTCWQELSKGVLHVPQTEKFTEIHQKWQPIWLVLALTSLALKEVIKDIHAKSMTFAMQSGVLMLLFTCGRCQWLTFLVEGDCCLIDVITLIDAQGMGKIMPNASMASTQRAWNFLLLSWGLRLLCTCKSCSTEFFLLSMIFAWCCCCHHCYRYNWIVSDHALLILIIPNHCYFSPNSIHTCYTP